MTIKVKDVIDTMSDYSSIGGTSVRILVKPPGTAKNYYNSDNCRLLRDEVAKMDVQSWSIFSAKKNKCDFVIVVDRNMAYEEACEDRAKRLFGADFMPSGGRK